MDWLEVVAKPDFNGEQTVHEVIHVKKIPQDAAVSEDRYLCIVEGLLDEPVEDAVLIMNHLMA